MLRNRRLIATVCLGVLTAALGGCSSINVPSFDPSDMLDFLDTKKKAVGERKPVFPGGVPGVSQGVPKELYRGNAELMAAAPAPVEAQPEPAPTRRKAAPQKRTARAKSQVEIAPDDVNVEDVPPAR